MKLSQVIIASAIFLGSTTYAPADEAHHPEQAGQTPPAAQADGKPGMGMMQGGNMPMQGGQPGMGMMPGMMQGGKGMGMMNPEHMQKMMAMKQEHMQKMEQHMANMEALLKELVELQKAQAAK